MVSGFYDTRRPLRQLRGEMDRLWNGFLGPMADSFLTPTARAQPAVNLWEQGDALMAEMELPGVKSEQVDISVVGNELSIKIERPEQPQEGVTYHRRERPEGSFTRLLRLPVEVNPERVEAQLRDGVLTITLPKAESAKPRKINVTGA